MAEQTVEFYGDTFKLHPDGFSEFAYLEYSEIVAEQEKHPDTPSAKSGAAIVQLVVSCLADGEEEKFRATARKNRAKTEKLMDVLKAALEDSTERPTGQPTDSSDGPTVIEAKFGTGAVGKVERAFNGRPELQVGILDSLGIETG